MGSTRNIRLKEHSPNNETSYEVAALYRNVANESLGEGPFLLRTDMHGFICTGNEVLPEGEPVAFLGDSFVESTYASEESRFISQVERITGFPCLNGGYSGSTTLHSLNSMINKIYPVVGLGGRVVLFVGQTDSAAVEYDGTYWSAHRRGAPIIPPVAPLGTLPQGLDSTRRILQLVVDSAAVLGIKLVLATSAFSMPDFSSDRAIRMKYKRNREAYYRNQDVRLKIVELVREMAEANRVPFIDGHAFVGGDAAYFYDELHLNEAGQTYFAKFLAKELQRIL